MIINPNSLTYEWYFPILITLIISILFMLDFVMTLLISNRKYLYSFAIIYLKFLSIFF